MAFNQTAIPHLLSNASKTAANTTTSTSAPTLEDVLSSFRLPLSLMASGVVAGNSLVCALFCRYRKLRTITNTFVVSLAVSDCLVALIFVPCFLLTAYVEYFGLVIPYIICYILFAYLFNFCGVTYDRYQAIVKPLSYNGRMTRRIVNKILVVVWTAPLVLALVPATWEKQSQKAKALATRINQGFLVFVVTVSVVTICLAYSKIFKETRRQVKWMISAHCQSPVIEKNTHFHDETKGATRTRKLAINLAAEVKAAKVFAILIITFTVCWLPLIIINTIEALGYPSSVPKELIDVSLFTLVGNSLIDPFIYSLYKSDFRNALKKFFNCHDPRKDSELTSNSNHSFKESFRSTKPPLSAVSKQNETPLMTL